MILLAKNIRILTYNNSYERDIDEFERFFPNGLDLDKFKIKTYTEILQDFCSWINLLKKQKFVVDSRNNIIEQTDLAGNSIKYEYDEHDRLIKWIHSSNGIFEWKYDSYGNMIEESLNGQITYKNEFIYENNTIKKVFVNNILILEIVEN